MKRSFRKLLTSLLAMLVFPASALFAQTASPQPQIIKSEDAGRDRSNDEPFDIPELFGSRPFKPGERKELAPLLVEYSTRAGSVYERISIFENGVVSVHLNSEGAATKKALIVSDEAMAIYREQVTQLPLDLLARTEMPPSVRNRASIRIVRNDRVETRFFSTTEALPYQVENFRLLLVDLLRAVADDRQVTNPLTGYTPKVGDKLITEDKHMYEVKRILSEGTIVEVELLGKPTKMYVPIDMIYKMFIDVRPARSQ